MDDNQLAKETLIEACSYVQKVIIGIDYISEKFLAGREDLALNSVVNLIDGIKWLVEVIELTIPTQKELKIEIAVPVMLKEIMHELVTAFENRDYVLAGDLLNYEIRPIIEEWKEALSELESSI